MSLFDFVLQYSSLKDALIPGPQQLQYEALVMRRLSASYESGSDARKIPCTPPQHVKGGNLQPISWKERAVKVFLSSVVGED